ncbi:MAG: DUF2975 domain-containing protein [Tunicatimonas sp.]|uniref:DUF2975 domain-containing protein n=1 Tax=Tunicatimonas sp. TaxID=1940096 RepID=UPI003C73AB4D
MKRISLLTAWKWIIILFQISFIVIPIITGIMIYRMGDNGTGFTTLEFSGFSFVPEDQKVINEVESISIAFKKDLTIAPKILVSETIIRLEDGGESFRTGIISLSILFVILAVFGLEQLKRMIKTVELGTPFVRINVWRIYILSTLFFLVPLMENINSYLQERWFISNFEFSGMMLKDDSMGFTPWFIAGVLLLTIGKIMERGIKIQEEQDLTI